MQGPGAARRGNTPRPLSVPAEKLIDASQDEAAIDEIIKFGAETVTVKPGDPVPEMRGLADLVEISGRSDGSYYVRFADGTRAIVDPEKHEVAFAEDGDYTNAQLRAAIIAALAERSLLSDSRVDHLAHLADAYAYHRDLNNPESLRTLAEAGRDALRIEDEDFTVNSSALFHEAQEQEKDREPLPRSIAREMRKRFEHVMRNALRGTDPSQAAMALLHQVDDSGTVMVDPEQIKERLDAAKRLGGEHLIPDSGINVHEEPCGECTECEAGNPCAAPKLVSTGTYYVGEQEQKNFFKAKNRLEQGQRTMILRGPPGTGKDRFLRELAALRRMPYIPINIGPGFSIEDQLGGDGLVAKEIRDPKTGEIRQVATVTEEVQGPLARAVQEPAMVVIQEPAGMKHELVRLHSIAGDNVGEPESRTLQINSTKGQLSIPVHPDCIVAFTYNEGKEGEWLGDALHDRSCNLDFEVPSEEDEARRYQVILKNKLLKNQQEFPQLHDKEPPLSLCRNMVKAMRQLRSSHVNDPKEIIRGYPGGRTGPHVMADLIMEGAQGNEQAVAMAIDGFHYLMEGTEAGNDYESRTQELDTILQDHLKGLREIARWGAETVEQAEQKAQKSSGKAKSKSKAKSKEG